MNIIYLHQYFTTPLHFGGVRSYEFAKRLVQKGNTVDLVTSTAFYPAKKMAWWRFISKENIDGICVHIIHVSYSNEMSLPRRMLSFLLFLLVSSIYILMLKKRDLLLASSTPLTIAVPALIYCFLKKVPLVFEVRDLWPDVPIAMGFIKNRIIISLLLSFERVVYKYSEKIVALSPGIAAGIVAKGVASEKITVVPNACDLLEFSQHNEQPELISDLKSRSNVKVCVYAGTFGFVNGLDYILDMAGVQTDICDVKYVLIGAGAEKKRLQKRIVDEQLHENVYLLDRMSKKEVIAYLQYADACISTVQEIPALYDNSANKFFDSLAAGKPIIINHLGWQAKVIEQNNLGLVLTKDIGMSVRRLESYLKNNEASASCIRSYAERYYSRDVLFEKFYNEAIIRSISLGTKGGVS